MYIDTANLEEIREAYSLGIIKGVTTNPTILLKEGKKREVIVKEILASSNGTLFVQAVGKSFEEIYQDCEKILSLGSSRLALKIPASVSGLQAIKKVKEEYSNVDVLATAIYSVEQGILCGLAGSDFIAPYINRMENNNINPYDLVRKTRRFYDDRGIHTKILGASFKNTNQLVHTLDAGAHTATVSFEILKGMITKQLAEKSIQNFNKDWERLQQQL